MGLPWSSMGLPWVTHGITRVSHGSLWSILGLHRVPVSFRRLPVSPGASHGLPMGLAWVSHGSPRGLPWVAYAGVEVDYWSEMPIRITQGPTSLSCSVSEVYVGLPWTSMDFHRLTVAAHGC